MSNKSGDITITDHRVEQAFKKLIEKTIGTSVDKIKSKSEEESSVLLGVVTKWYYGIDQLQVELLKNNKLIKCFINYNIFSKDCLISYTPDGINKSDDNGYYVIPKDKLYCLVVKVTSDDYFCLGFIDRDNVNSIVGSNEELVLQVGRNKISLSKDYINILADNFFVNGLPYSEPKLANYDDTKTINEKLENKQDTLVSGENIKTINNQSLLGEGNINIQGGSGDYPSLSGKPKINNIELLGNKSLSDLGINIPTKTSDLTNDSNYITSSYHDNTKQDKINDLDSIRNGAGKGLTALQNGDNISELVNNVGYLTSHQSLSNYYNKSETDSKIVNHHDTSKEDVISDLSVIRSGAYLGATALQTGDNVSELINDKDYASKEWIKWYSKQPLTLSLTSDNQYVLTGEPIVLTCVLQNNKNKGFAGEVINLNDLLLTTNSNGVATQTITGITEETKFTASYEDLTSDVTVYIAYLKDSFNHQSLSSDWTNTDIESISYDTTEQCLLFDNTVGSGNIVSSSSKLFLNDFVIEFDLKTATPYNMSLGVRNEANANLNNKRSSALSVVADTWAHIKIVRTGTTITYYKDGEEKVSDTITTVPARFRFYNDAVNSFMIKNFIAYPNPIGLFLKIIPSSQYVVADESFVISVLLRDGLGNGISGAEITLEGSDGSLYSGITNELGVINFNISSISSDTTFTATYESLSTEITIEYCLFYDYGVTGRKQDYIISKDNLACTVDETCTTLTKVTGTSTGTSYYNFRNSSGVEPSFLNDFSIEMDFRFNSVNRNAFSLVLFGTLPSWASANVNMINLNLSQNNWYSLKITVIDNEIKYYVDNVQKYTTSLTNPTKMFEFMLADNNAQVNDFIQYKNYRVKSL